MKGAVSLLLVLLFLLTLSFQGKPPPPLPDLTASIFVVLWTKAKVEVKNIGTAPAGSFMVYINADENPVSKMDRMQFSFSVPSLAVGHTVHWTVDFLEKFTNNNYHGANVYQVQLIIDPKNQVQESNENNNIFQGPVTH